MQVVICTLSGTNWQQPSTLPVFIHHGSYLELGLRELERYEYSLLLLKRVFSEISFYAYGEICKEKKEEGCCGVPDI